jgi:predicted nucleic acid-binding protein
VAVVVLVGPSEGLGPFDAVLAATARRRGRALASADRSFGTVEGLGT